MPSVATGAGVEGALREAPVQTGWPGRWAPELLDSVLHLLHPLPPQRLETPLCAAVSWRKGVIRTAGNLLNPLPTPPLERSQQKRRQRGLLLEEVKVRRGQPCGFCSGLRLLPVASC
jgi:hypothetical protein